MAKKTHPTGPDFLSYYEANLGQRWTTLRKAMVEQTQYFHLHCPQDTYHLDEASFLASLCLDVRPQHDIADFCAAPGGKCLSLALRWLGVVPQAPGPDAFASPQTITTTQPLEQYGSFIANERSSQRRDRLIRVLRGHLGEAFASRIQVTSHDASRWGSIRPQSLDRIMLDAPCSSERHVLADPKSQKQWTKARIEHLAQMQYSLLLAAFDALRPGGVVLYATCSINPKENDDVVQRVLQRIQKKQAQNPNLTSLAIETPLSSIDLHPDWREQIEKFAEPTKFGLQIWPDKADGRGPLWFCRLRKTSLS